MKKKQADYRKFDIPKRELLLIEQLEQEGWEVGQDGSLLVPKKSLARLTKKFPLVVLYMQPDTWAVNKVYRFKLPFPSTDRDADTAMSFLKQRGMDGEVDDFSVVYDVPHGVAETIPHLSGFRYSKGWKSLSGPGSLEDFVYMLQKDAVRFQGTYDVYGEYGTNTVPIKGKLKFWDIEGWQSGRPTKDQIVEAVQDYIQYELEDLEGSGEAPWIVNPEEAEDLFVPTENQARDFLSAGLLPQYLP